MQTGYRINTLSQASPSIGEKGRNRQALDFEVSPAFCNAELFAVLPLRWALGLFIHKTAGPALARLQFVAPRKRRAS
jgi:hypothetical protein